ncbi:Uncharacterised protein [Serratia fonticola]|uniref:Uncharacterized protein n=1 Tax=Serratia fonticola TaxID=47917 RepID=A0A4U9V2X7_SERFO|nr:Uncharacterised protein [Serratia fonticola]
MIRRYLRQCSKAELNSAQSAKRWQRLGGEVVHSIPLPKSNLLAFSCR